MVYVSMGIVIIERAKEQAVMFAALEMFLLCAYDVMQESSIPHGSPDNTTNMSVVSRLKCANKHIPKVSMGNKSNLKTETIKTSSWNLNPDAGNDEKYIPIKNAESIGTTSEM